MRKIFFLAVLLLINGAVTAQIKTDKTLLKDGSTTAKTLSDADRKSAVDYLTKTKMQVLNDVKGLSPDQLNFKESPERWSIAQCLEHIALAENFIWTMVESGINAPANPEMRDSIKFKDDQMIAMITDRSKKFQAREFLVPNGTKLPTVADAEKSFIELRDNHIKYVETTDVDLRDHVSKHPGFGWVDSYQMIMFMAAHSERHAKQIEQVKADPKFPKK